MHLKISKEKLLFVLSSVGGVVDRRSDIHILTHFKFEVSDHLLVVTASDLEVQLKASIELSNEEVVKEGSVAIPARKLLDICKALPNESNVSLEEVDLKCIVKSGRSRFSLSTLNSVDYPLLEAHSSSNVTVQLKESDFKKLLKKTEFSMAVQDVRFYLTGMLCEFENDVLRTVTTDGHRLALCEVAATCDDVGRLDHGKIGVILPRKAVNELGRLLLGGDQLVALQICKDLAMLSTLVVPPKNVDEALNIEMVTKLIDGRFPEYQRVIPKHNSRHAVVNLVEFRQALQRVSILSNEKVRGVTLIFDANQLEINSNNAENDKAVETLGVQFADQLTNVGVNVTYVLDILNQWEGENVDIQMGESNQAILITNTEDSSIQYVVMPMRI